MVAPYLNHVRERRLDWRIAEGMDVRIDWIGKKRDAINKTADIFG